MADVPLTSLDPRWVGAGGPGIFNRGADCSICDPKTPNPRCAECEGRGYLLVPAPARHGIGISFLCPCAVCTPKRSGNPDLDFSLRIFVAFSNPLDGGPSLDPQHAEWQRTGETFDTLSLTPSILRNPDRGGCGWHGFVVNGVVQTV